MGTMTTQTKPKSVINNITDFLGVATLVIGVVIGAAVAWDTYGTNLVHQDVSAPTTLPSDVPGSEIAFTPVALDDPTFAAPVATAPPSDASNPVLALTDSTAFGSILIPAINLDQTLIVGVSTEALTKGPGWIIGSAAPGDLGNSVISGHRTTHGGPFRKLDSLQSGDRITILVPGMVPAVYEVRAQFIVAPEDVYVAAPSSGVRLTLTTCNPVGSARERLIIQAELISGANLASAVPATQWTQSTR